MTLCLILVTSIKAAGNLLLVSAGLGLANTAANDLGIWKKAAAYFSKSEEMQKKIASQIDFAMTYLSIGLAIIGGFEAYRLGAFEAARQAGKDAFTLKLKQALWWLSTVFHTTTHLGKHFTERQTLLASVDMEALETKVFLLREQLKSKDSQTQQTLKMAQIITEETSRILASAEVYLSH